MSQYYEPYAPANFGRNTEAFQRWDDEMYNKAQKLQERRWKIIRELRDY